MRELKFRAWDKHTEKMYFSERENDEHWFGFQNGKLAFFEAYEESATMDEPAYPACREANAVTMQHTGLRDKNGKEIFEGDVVNLWWEEMFFQGEVAGSVSWRESGACFDIDFASSSTPLAGLDLDYSQIEVIGNIYENPDLVGE